MILTCSHIKLSNSQTKFLEDVDTGVLISDLTLHLRKKKRKRSRHLLYSTLLEYPL